MARLFKCYIQEDGWGTVYTSNTEYIWAENYEDARKHYCLIYGFRKNKKGLTVEEIEYRYSKAKILKVNRKVTKKQLPFLGGYEYEVERAVEIKTCGHCGKELNSKWCTYCNTESV